ncbi:apolipoprotein L3-like [Leucoraja erinacea]|uniref:apolipoprotein L3-like n=1 Tax=Leucoraja erinaceus TaxID=7782 RepID=UPI0024561132|nr:apolipoprotein L3-like [Leucoraja erinacea]
MELQRMADEIDSYHQNATIANVAGSSAGLAGGILSIAGLIAAPFTMGSSLLLTGVGVTLGAAGGVTNIVSNVSDNVNQKNKRKRVNEIIEGYKAETMRLTDKLILIKDLLEFLTGCREEGLANSTAIAKSSHTVMKSLSCIVAMTSTVSRSTLRTITAVSGVLVGLLMIWDIYSIVKDAKKIHRRQSTEIAQRLREIAQHIAQERRYLIDNIQVYECEYNCVINYSMKSTLKWKTY